jgi:flagellar biosynthesis protein FlhA
MLLPPVRIKDDPDLPGLSYAVLIHGVEVARGEVHPTLLMVIDPAGEAIGMPGEKVKEPTFGLDAVWIDPGLTNEAEGRGYTVIDPESVITTHLTETLKGHLSELLTHGLTQKLIGGLDRDYQKLAAEIANPAPKILLQHVLQALLGERVSIRNLPLIVEAIAEVAPETKNLIFITDHVRARLANQICRALAAEDGYVRVMVMSAAWEAEFANAVSLNGDDKTFTMSPQRVQDFVLAARQEISAFADKDEWPALLVSPEVRSFVRSMLERVSPMTAVISHNEIHRSAALRTVATIGQ